MKVLRKLMIFGLVGFFCFSLKEGRADDEVRTYEPYPGEPGQQFTQGVGECVDYIKANRPDLQGVSYGDADGMPTIAGNAGFTVDTLPEKGSVISFAYASTGHVGVVQEIRSLPGGKYKLTIMDNNFVASNTIGKADYTYNPATGKIEELNYKTYWGTKDIVPDPSGSNYSGVKFIHENQTVVDAFTQHNIPPTAEQLEVLSQGLLQGNSISWLNSRFDSIGNNYHTFPNYYLPGEYLFSNASGQKEYKILLKKFEISADGSNWVTVGEGDVWLDLASAAANSTIMANYASNAHIPPGTYRYYRLTHGTYYTIKGYVTDPISGVIYYTTSNFYQSSQPSDNSRNGISSHTSSFNPSSPPSDYNACVMKHNSYSTNSGFAALSGGDSFTWAQPFAQPFQITAGTRKITLTFNMGSGIVFIPNGWVNNGHVNFDTGGTPIIPAVTAQ